MSLDSSRRDGISSWCKACRRVSTRKWKSLNPERIKKKVLPSYQQARGYTLKYRYNLSLADYENLLNSQDGSCAICHRKASEMTYHLHVDHSHETGEVRGLLCSPCNVYIGYIKENSEVLDNAKTYLQRRKNA